MAAVTAAVVAASAATYASRAKAGQYLTHNGSKLEWTDPPSEPEPDPVRVPIESNEEILRKNRVGLYLLGAFVAVAAYGVLSLLLFVPII